MMKIINLLFAYVLVGVLVANAAGQKKIPATSYQIVTISELRENPSEYHRKSISVYGIYHPVKETGAFLVEDSGDLEGSLDKGDFVSIHSANIKVYDGNVRDHKPATVRGVFVAKEENVFQLHFGTIEDVASVSGFYIEKNVADIFPNRKRFDGLHMRIVGIYYQSNDGKVAIFGSVEDYQERKFQRAVCVPEVDVGSVDLEPGKEITIEGLFTLKTASTAEPWLGTLTEVREFAPVQTAPLLSKQRR